MRTYLLEEDFKNYNVKNIRGVNDIFIYVVVAFFVKKEGIDENE